MISSFYNSIELYSYSSIIYFSAPTKISHIPDFSQRSSVANVEIEDSIASDELMYMDELEQARAIEQAALAEIELEMTTYPEPDADVPEEEATEATSRTLLKRELRAQALLRLEDGARTEDDTVWLSLDQMALGTLEKITDSQ